MYPWDRIFRSASEILFVFLEISVDSGLLAFGLFSDLEFVIFLTVLENAYLVYGLGQLTRDVNSDVRTLNFRSHVIIAPPRKSPKDVRKKSLCDVKCQKMKEMTNNK